MAQLGGRRRNDQRTQQANSGPKVWLLTCTGCERPVTIVAAVEPEVPRCAECGPAPNAQPENALRDTEGIDLTAQSDE